MSSAAASRWNRLASRVGPWLILFSGLTVATAASLLASQAAVQSDRARLDALVQSTKFRIETRLREHVAILRATAAYVESNADVNRQEFENYTSGSGLTKLYPGALAIGFAILETPANTDRVEKFAAASRAYRWTPNRQPGQRRIVVLFSSPDTPINRRAVGFDINSSQARRPFVNQAIDSGQLVYTPKLKLLGANARAQETGFLIYQATYQRSSQLQTTPERRAAATGIVYSPFSAERFFGKTLPRDPDAEVSVRVYDGAAEPDNLLYGTNVDVSDDAPIQRAVVTLPSRRWQVEVRPTAVFADRSPRRFVILVPIGGILVSLLAFYIALIQRRGRQRSELDAERLRREVAERERAEIQVRQLNEQLEATVQARTQELRSTNQELEAFVYSVSHDLRAPLRAIDGFSQVVLEDYGPVLPEDGRDALNRVRRATARMNNLINSLLNLSRITHRPLNLAPQNLSQVAHEAFDTVVSTLPPEAAIPVIEIQPGLTAVADEALLHVVFDNLIANAVKFSGTQPHPRITMGQTVRGFFVRDNGVGFDPEHAEKLFKPFERLHTEREFPGIGIGLATVQRIVRRHGGDIWAEGAVGGGATFWFTLGAASPPASGSNPKKGN